jgi:hydrogenase maturation protease
VNKRTSTRILVAGIGNPIRTDDGIGDFICKKIESFAVNNVTTLSIQQLQVEQIEEFANYHYVIIVDASVSGADAEILPVETDGTSDHSSSHHTSPGLLKTIAGYTGNGSLNLVLCKVRGEDFGFGDKLSDKALRNANKAVELILQWIDEH